MTRFDETRMQPAKDYAENYVREVTARYIGPRRKSLTISGPGDAASFMRGLLRDEVREHFLALYLNGAHQVVSFSLVSLGDATSAPVHAREVFQGALLVGACARSSGITTRQAMFSRAPRMWMSPGNSSKRGSCFESRFLTTCSFHRRTTCHSTSAKSWRDGGAFAVSRLRDFYCPFAAWQVAAAPNPHPSPMLAPSRPRVGFAASRGFAPLATPQLGYPHRTPSIDGRYTKYRARLCWHSAQQSERLRQEAQPWR